MTGARALHRYLAVAVLAIAGYFLLPPVAQNLAFIASNVAACATIVVARRTRSLRPRGGWLLLAAFPAATGVGNAVYFVNDSVRHVDPFPSPGDASFLGAYVLLAAGLVRLHRGRTADLDRPALVDTAILTLGFAAVSWVLFMAPVLHDTGVPLLARLTALGYPVADVLVLAVAVRFLLTRGEGTAVRALAPVVVLMLVADSAFAVLNLLDLYATGHPVDALILGYNLGWGAVALHPDADRLAAPVPVAAARPSWWRLGALTVASLTAPVVLLGQVLSGQTTGIVVTALCGVVLFLLVVLRMSMLVHRLETTLEQRRQLEAELEHRSLHDELTGLANRRCFVAAVRVALASAPAGGVTVLFLDLDHFKAVNDTYGHAAGDRLLVATAERLRQVLRPADLAARLGGDEFAVLLPARSGDRGVALRPALARPVPVPGVELSVSASIGTATSRPGDDVDDLLHAADTGMYEHKASRRGRTVPRQPGTPQRPAGTGAGQRGR